MIEAAQTASLADSQAATAAVQAINNAAADWGIEDALAGNVFAHLTSASEGTFVQALVAAAIVAADAIADADAVYLTAEAVAYANAVGRWADLEGTAHATLQADLAWADANYTVTIAPHVANYNHALHAAAGGWYATVVPGSVTYSNTVADNDLTYVQTVAPAWAGWQNALADNDLTYDSTVIPAAGTHDNAIVASAVGWVADAVVAGLGYADSLLGNALTWLNTVSGLLEGAANSTVANAVTYIGADGTAFTGWSEAMSTGLTTLADRIIQDNTEGGVNNTGTLAYQQGTAGAPPADD